MTRAPGAGAREDGIYQIPHVFTPVCEGYCQIVWHKKILFFCDPQLPSSLLLLGTVYDFLVPHPRKCSF